MTRVGCPRCGGLRLVVVKPRDRGDGLPGTKVWCRDCRHAELDSALGKVIDAGHFVVLEERADQVVAELSRFIGRPSTPTNLHAIESIRRRELALCEDLGLI